ncbi:hypothetical protein C7C45_29165 [Micromonospora arborensis]|uniref:Uncharacterized protein n=1 Tax=Micromonospora arborensis TaxID=2116518 RepID=A0A318NC49_9ACTN|nr:hypothetical protein [Micromonospora arborensis]PYC65423.1 hypothetical protein C7C45_29165 [Micromonospora arborensis]
MTSAMRKLSISVPPDVAERLERESNASAYITQAVRDRMRLDALDAELAHQGIQITEQGVAEARARRAAVEADWSPERRRAVRERARQHAVEAAASGTVDKPAA